MLIHMQELTLTGFMPAANVHIQVFTAITDLQAIPYLKLWYFQDVLRLRQESRNAAADINEKIRSDSGDLETYDFKIDNEAPHIPQGIRTEIRDIMQRAYFVIPDKEALPPDLEEVTKLKNFLCDGNFKIDRDYVEARSLTTVAYIVLKDAIEKLKSKEKMEENK